MIFPGIIEREMSVDGFVTGFGRTAALIAAIIGTIVGVALIVLGIAILNSPKKNNEEDPPPNVNNSTLGIVLIVFGVIIIIISWAWFYLAERYKTAAEASAFITGADLAYNIL